MGNFNSLPHDIMFEILSRLPIESVLEYKLVSKPWRNLIRQYPSFSQTNHLDSARKLSFIFDTPDCYEEDLFWFNEVYTYTEYNENLNCFITRSLRMSSSLPNKFCYILGSCNGLICFNASLDRKTKANNQSLLLLSVYEPAYICNPVTREYLVLPKPVGNKVLTGFGYTPSTNEYKVVRTFNSRTEPNFGSVQVYTLGSGVGWRNVKAKMEYDVNGTYSRDQFGVFANGSVHWVSCRGIIVAFHLADEEFLVLRPPPCLPHGNRFPLLFKLLVLGDCICVYFCRYQGSELWVLKKNWNKEFSNLSRFEKPITFTKSGGLLCYNYGDKNVYHYAPEASPSRMLVDFGKNFEFGVPHNNTLVSLKALGEKDAKLLDSFANGYH
ncbi:F-box protein At3g07870-like [Papaver somniferum]|uniref:F-box protein At3g07870-like n=1 Tax=Papaver somniferum TaxID=3469 RepID=UPI000E6FE0E4|nr:F-box protein At3g07870-like [Papaver somniferum]